MQVIETKDALRACIRKHRSQGRSIGFVPTMGYLHAGHLSLIRRARLENDVVVVSVFVNPTQFGPEEDLDAYPRDTGRDLTAIRGEGTDIAFFPAVAEMYPSGYHTYVQVEGSMTQVLCGRSRPAHFRGVTTVVTKLFHLVQPDRAYFGQKDAQQVAVLRKMVRDLDFGLQLIACPTIRESDGLAMSSRNAYLTAEQRRQAPIIAQALFEARDQIAGGQTSARVIIDLLQNRITAIDSAIIDYVSIVEAASLTELSTLHGQVLIAVAVKLGRTRLIDNIVVEV